MVSVSRDPRTLDTPAAPDERGAMFPNPAITGTAVIKGLDPNQATAHHADAEHAQAALDEADLQELERAEYYGDRPAPEAHVEARRRSLFDRILRR